ncbi:MAG: hypothetical protein U1E45_09640 [Geminicoccaceae bacterium]
MLASEEILRPDQPFGDAEHHRIPRQSAELVELIDLVPPFTTPLFQHATVILGRKGSGKTSIISTYRLAQEFEERFKASRSGRRIQLTTQGDLCISVLTWDRFYDMNRSVRQKIVFADPTLRSASLIPAEKIEQFWSEVIWEEIFKHFFDFSRDNNLDNEFKCVRGYFNFDLYIKDISLNNAFSKTFEAACKEVLTFLAKQNKKCYVLFDNMEDYPVLDPVFHQVLTGFLRCVNGFTQQYKEIDVIFCFPEEIEAYLNLSSSLSSNILKDYQRSFRLRWQTSELWSMALHRYRLFLRKHDHSSFQRISSLDLSKGEGRRIFIDLLFPATVTNEFGSPEDPIAYVTRHTHLLPRHLLVILNGIAVRAREKSGQYIPFDNESIKNGIADRERIVATDILALYRTLYPDLVKELRKTLPDLQPVFTYGELDKTTNRMNVNELDQYDLWRVLFQIGIIGKVEEETDRYFEANFYFNTNGNIGFASDARYCLHPLFSKFFDVVRRDGHSRKVVYPKGIEMIDRK